jgi:hypothetical protein
MLNDELKAMEAFSEGKCVQLDNEVKNLGD